MPNRCFVLILLALTACTPVAKPPAKDPVPAQSMQDTFKSCLWQKITGKTLYIWAYACGPEFRNEHLVADDGAGGFALVDDGDHRVVIRTFHKAADADIATVLPAINALSKGPHSEACALVPVPDKVDWLPGKLYRLEPTGQARINYDRDNQKEPTDPPCGEMGESYSGDRFFKVMDDDATTVVYLDMGSEIQTFDPATLKTLK